MENNSRQKAWFYWRLLVAAVLGVAAIFKVVNFIQITSGDGLLASPAMLLIAIGFESVVATYLLIGEPSVAWMATMGTFSILAASAGFALATSQRCNCLTSSLGPAVMLPVDLAILAISFLLRPLLPRQSGGRTPVHIAVSIFAGVVMVALAGFRQATITHAPPLKFLLAKTTIGRPWPLDDRFHPELRPLSSGKWMVLVARADCDHCRALIQNYFANPRSHRVQERTVIFLAIANKWQFQFDEVTFTLESPAVLTWDPVGPFVASPAVFLLENGFVIDASDGKETTKLIEKLHLDFVQP